MLSRWHRIVVLPALASNALSSRWRAGGAVGILTGIPELIRQTYLLLSGAVPPVASSAAFVAPSVESPFSSWLRVNVFTAGSEADLQERLATSESRLCQINVTGS